MDAENCRRVEQEMGKDIMESMGMDTITLKQMVILLQNDPKRLKFLKHQIEVEGLQSNTLTIKNGLSIDKKLEIVENEIDNWVTGKHEDAILVTEL